MRAKTTVELLDKGRLIIGREQVVNGTKTIYTVAEKTVFYLLHYDLNLEHAGAGSHWGQLHFFDGTTVRPICDLASPDAVDHCHTEGNGLIAKIPYGWSIRVTANAFTTAIGGIIGVEVIIA